MKTRKDFLFIIFPHNNMSFSKKVYMYIFFASLPLLLLMMRDNKQTVAKDADDNE